MENLQLIYFNMGSKTVWIHPHESEVTVLLSNNQTSRFNQETESKGATDETNEAGGFEIPEKDTSS